MWENESPCSFLLEKTNCFFIDERLPEKKHSLLNTVHCLDGKKEVACHWKRKIQEDHRGRQWAIICQPPPCCESNNKALNYAARSWRTEECTQAELRWEVMPEQEKTAGVST